MNERIKELAEQAGFDVYSWNENELEKFANLIVADCIEIVQPCKCGCNEGGNQISVTLGTTVEMIKEHFGVEK
jgi:hypothetical protein